MAASLPFPLVWAENSPNLREPTAPELDQGFPCGAADRELFNRLFQDLQQAINALFLRAGNADIPVKGWQAAPPSSPTLGDIYVVAASPTGAWAGQATKIAMWVGTWAFADPIPALQVQYWSGRQVVLRFDGTTWAEDLASESAPGRVELSTPAEALAGLSTSLAVTPAGLTRASRRRLEADTTVYVATTGNDTNPGTQASPFATIQRAYDYIAKNFDLAGYKVTIKCAAGNYAAGLEATGAPLGQTQPIRIEGANPTTGVGTTIDGGAKSCFAVSNNAVIRIVGFTMTTGGANAHCVYASYGGIIYLGDAAIGGTNVFGNAGGSAAAHIAAGGGQIQIDFNYTVTAQATFHFYNIAGSIVNSAPLTCFITTSQTYAVFCSVTGNTAAIGVIGIVFALSGGVSVFGQRWSVSLKGVINTQGAGANLFPGSVDGSAQSGGQYA